jgi:hypothetical protein
MTDPWLERRRPSDEELDEAARITPEDIERAMEMWDRDSGMPGLLDAEPVGDDPSEGP